MTTDTPQADVMVADIMEFYAVVHSGNLDRMLDHLVRRATETPPHTLARWYRQEIAPTLESCRAILRSA
jgi:hypothetical protein